MEDKSFEKGFNYYLTEFIANDLDYTFEKSGEESRANMEQFKVENVALIKARRVELGLEKN